MLDIVVQLQVGARLEAHQGHTDLVKLLDLPHLFVSDLHFLVSNRVESADFLSVKRLTGLVTDESLRAPQLLVVDGVDPLDAGLLGWDDRAEERERNLGAWRDIEHALAYRTLLELFLPDALHQLEDARLGALDTE